MLRAIVAVLLLIAAIIAFGPRAEVDAKAEAAQPRAVPTDPDALEAFVRGEQGSMADLVPGTEARIVWHEPERTPTFYSVIYLHGFSSSRQETAPLAEEVAKALEANLYEARFTGHGRSGEALAEASAEAWLRDTREALRIGRALGEKVIVLACSTGASFATVAGFDLTAEDRPYAFVYFSPNFAPRAGASEMLLWPWARWWVPLVAGAERSWEAANPDHDRYWTTRYPIAAVFPMMAGAAAARNGPVERISVPLHVFLSPDDPIVVPEVTRKRAAAWGAEHVVTEVEGPGDNHVVAGRILAPARTSTLAKAVVTWVRKLP